MTRFAYDTTGDNAQWVQSNLPRPDVMLWYGTGSADIAWTDAEKSLFDPEILVEIDQGGGGSPIPTATVRDVENGAWTPAQAVDRNGWDAERPTIYCSRVTLPFVLGDGWEGDILLAWPEWAGEPLPSTPGCTIIGVQDKWYSQYDHTTLLDPYWPHAAPPSGTTDTLSMTVTGRTADWAFHTIPDAGHYVVEYVADSGMVSVVIGRIPQPPAPMEIHPAPIHVPGVSGGTVTVYGIVNSKAVVVGSRKLP